MARYILGIDQGTAGTKAVIFDHRAQIVATAFCEVTQRHPHAGWVEQDASEIWEASIKAIAEAFKNGRLVPEDIEAIGISNQIGTTVFWNRVTGEPIGRAIVWQDQRTLPICERLSGKDHAGIKARTGLVILPNAAATKIRWLMENDKAVQSGLARGELLFGTINSWLIWKLSGGTTHVTDYSNACLALLLNVQSLSYDEWMLDELEIPREILPELRGSSEIYAYTSPEVFYGVQVPIAGALPDQQAAVFGQACFQAGMAKNTFGTGASLTVNTGSTHIAAVGGLTAPVLWAIDGEVVYSLAGWTNVSGAAIRWLRDGLGLVREPKEAESLARQVPDTEGVYFVPACLGLGAPYFDSNARGTIIGLTEGTTKPHIARAALEAMAYQTRDAFEVMKRQAGFEIKIIRADGGAAVGDFLLQFLADILNTPVERPRVTEMTVLGAAYLAGLGVGYWQSTEELASLWQLDRRFEPSMTEEQREELYQGWQKAIKHAKGWLKE